MAFIRIMVEQSRPWKRGDSEVEVSVGVKSARHGQGDQGYLRYVNLCQEVPAKFPPLRRVEIEINYDLVSNSIIKWPKCQQNLN